MGAPNTKSVSFDAIAFARAAAPAVGLDLSEDEIQAVAANLERTAAFADLLATVDGLDETQPAPVFRAGEGC